MTDNNSFTDEGHLPSLYDETRQEVMAAGNNLPRRIVTETQSKRGKSKIYKAEKSFDNLDQAKLFLKGLTR